MARKAKAAAVVQAIPLTGKVLLQKLKDIPQLSRREKAQDCGYYTVLEDEQIRINSGEFLNAVLEAKGVSLEGASVKNVRGKAASYRAVVQKNGILIVGAAYTRKVGSKPGDEFEIKLGRKHIQLLQVGTESVEE